MNGPLLFYIPLFIVAMVVLAFGSAIFGRRGYQFRSPFSMCCGCATIAILLPMAVCALKMLAKMYSAFDQ